MLSCTLYSEDSSSSDEASDSSDLHFPDLNAETLLLFEDVKVIGADTHANLCWDQGSTRSLVTHSFAKACSMRGQNIVYRLDVVGSKGEPMEGCYYVFDLGLNDGTSVRVWAYGIDQIMDPPEPVDLSPVRHLFPHLPNFVFAPRSKRPVDILLGNNFLGLHPSGGQGRDAVGNLRAYQSQFGHGWVVAGTHSDVKPSPCQLSPSASHLARINKCEIIPELLPDFWEGDSLGVLPPKRCGKCLRCSDCTDPALVHSRREQDELEMLEKGVKFPSSGCTV